MVLAGGGVVGLVAELGSEIFAVDTPCDVVRLPVDGVGVRILSGVGGNRQVLFVIVCELLLA